MTDSLPPHKTPGGTSRRDFLRRAGAGLGVAASALAFQACGETGPETPTEGTLQGFVLNPDGEPVQGAVVTLEGSTAMATTDANGFYRINDLSAGEYTVTVTSPPLAIGTYPAQTATVNIVAGGTGYTQNFNFGSTLAPVTFDFSNDFGVLNYAYALEQLEAAFYATVVGNSAFAATFNADEQGILRDLAAHEAIHRDFLKAAITAAGGTAIPDLLPNFQEIDFADRADVLATAQTFEDLGVGAYNGAGQYIASDVYLTIAGKIVSVEARHASVISGLITPNAIAGSGVIDANALDRALRPSAVLTAADPFIFNTVSASNVPTA